jgi:hypothetical protein
VIVSIAAQDPDACTRFAVTVAPTAIAPRSVARTIGDVVMRCGVGVDHDDVVLAVHDVLDDAVARHPSEPFSVRVRQRGDRIDIEVADSSPEGSVTCPGALHVAHACSDEVRAEVTETGNLVRVTFRTR